MLASAALGCGVFAQAHAGDVKTDIDVGAEMYHENYHEEVDGSKFMQEEGWMYGVNGTATFHFSDEHGVKLSGRYAQGSSDYTGANQGGSYGSLTSNGQDRYVYELRGVYQNTSSWDGQPATFSIGLGYRNLTDRLDQSGNGGYKRENELFYATIGGESTYNLGSNWQVTPKVSYNYLLQGKQHSYLDGVTLNNTQKHGSGYELSATFSTKINNQYGIKITPFWRYWSIHKSDDVYFTYGGNTYVGSEPKNMTQEYGLNLSMAF